MHYQFFSLTQWTLPIKGIGENKIRKKIFFKSRIMNWNLEQSILKAGKKNGMIQPRHWKIW